VRGSIFRWWYSGRRSSGLKLVSAGRPCLVATMTDHDDMWWPTPDV
jgi:hypothetical protein